MGQGITVNIVRDESRLKQQVRLLMHHQLQQSFKKNRFFLYLFLSANIISVVLVLLLKDRVVVGVSGWFLFFTAFLWLGAITFGGTALLNFYSGLRRNKRSVEEYLRLTPQSRLYFDDKSIAYITGENRLTYTWSVFTEYFEKGGNIYLVPNQQLIQAFYFSREDIGDEAFSRLALLARAHIR